MTLRDEFGRNLQRIRRSRNMSQEELAHHAGIDRGYVGKMENRHYSASLDTIEKLAEALDVHPTELLEY